MRRTGGFRVSRWWLVAVAAIAMGMIGTYQFVWSSIRVSLGARIGASETALGTVFTLFVFFQTTSQFPAGWVRDRIGPRIPMTVGSVLVFVGYAGLSWAPTITYVYLFYALGGIGVGTIYTIAVNTPVKWFDDRRGLATGIVTFSYPMISFLLIPTVQGRITDEFTTTMLGLAVLAGVVTFLGVPFLRNPGPGEGPRSERTQANGGTAVEDGPDGEEADASEQTEPAASDQPAQYTWREAIRTWQFWVLYAVFIVVNGVGLMIIGKIVAFANEMGLPTAAAAAASVVALSDGIGVVVGGSVSDRFGRERTIAGMLVLCGVSLAGATLLARGGLSLPFIVLIGAAAFFRGPAFSVFPSLVGDYYGTAHSSENYAALYSSKLWGGILGGTVTSLLIVRFGWDATFLLGAVLIAAAGVAAAFLEPVDAETA